MPRLGDATDRGDVLCYPSDIYGREYSRSLPSRSRLMYGAEANVPYLRSWVSFLGELFYLSSWARTAVLQETEV